jgi:hypothetical protein
LNPMMPSFQTKEISALLAESLHSAEGMKTFRLLTDLLTVAEEKSRAAATPPVGIPPAPSPVRVGVWEKDEARTGGAFVRTRCGEPWHFWADVAEIPQKGSKKRVILIGSSVARGYFYDPDLNPAQMLRQILQFQAGSEEIEVLDLARLGLQLVPLLRLMQSAVVLKPDVVVVFAGNNWHPGGQATLQDLRNISKILISERECKVVKTYFEGKLISQVDTVLKTMQKIGSATGITFIFMIPEFNLRDWEGDPEGPIIVDSERLRQWLEVRRQAAIAIAQGDDITAKVHAETLLELDGGTSPAGYKILASLRSCAGTTESRRWQESARDAGIALTRAQSPRCYSMTQNALRERAAAHNVHVVDLPKIFEEYLGGGIPGESLFHDYCHLTADGMRVAMAAVVEKIIPILCQKECPLSTLLDFNCNLDPRIAARAHFLSAIHNSYWGNMPAAGRSVRSALRECPELSELMKSFVDFQIREAPNFLCSAFEQLFHAEGGSIIPHLRRSSRAEKTIDHLLIEEIVSVLEVTEPGFRQSVEDLSIKDHAVQKRKRNLLLKLYRGAHDDRGFDEDRCGYYRAVSERSRFVFFSEVPQAVDIRLVTRTAVLADRKKIRVEVNGRPARSVAASPEWRRALFCIPRSLVRKGINRLDVIWPVGRWNPEHALQYADSLAGGQVADGCPVYGEIQTLTAECL